MFQIPQIGLSGQKIGIEHMAKLMGKQAADDLIAFQSAANLCNDLIAAVDLDHGIVRTSHIGVLVIPVKIHVDTTVVLITSRLRRSDIFKVTCKNPGGKKLAVGDFASLFVEKLSDLLMTDSCHS